MKPEVAPTDFDLIGLGWESCCGGFLSLFWFSLCPNLPQGYSQSSEPLAFAMESAFL